MSCFSNGDTGKFNDTDFYISSLKIYNLQSTYFKITAGNVKSGTLFSRYYYQRRLYKRAIEDSQVSEEVSDDISADISPEDIAG